MMRVTLKREALYKQALTYADTQVKLPIFTAMGLAHHLVQFAAEVAEAEQAGKDEQRAAMGGLNAAKHGMKE